MKPELFKKPKIKQKHIIFGAVAVLAIYVLVFYMKDEKRYSWQYINCINTAKEFANLPGASGKSYISNCDIYK